jgi:hypothetical protein
MANTSEETPGVTMTQEKSVATEVLNLPTPRVYLRTGEVAIPTQEEKEMTERSSHELWTDGYGHGV